MGTISAAVGARLDALLLLFKTWALVTGLLALVQSAPQHFPALSSAGNLCEVARDVLPQLVTAHALLVDQHRAGWARLLAVTGVGRWMFARVLPLAWLDAFWRFGAACDGRVDDGLSAVASQLIEASSPAGWAEACMAHFVALVRSAGEFLAANDVAGVVAVGAALEVALVPAALPLLVALPLTQDRLISELNTGDFFLAGTASTLDVRLFLAGIAFSSVALHQADVG